MTEHKPMLAPSKLADVTNLDFPVMIQPKYDGFRATYIPNIGFVSRTGKTFRNKNLPEYFKSIYGIADTVLDGEFYVPNTPFQDLSRTVSTEDAEIAVDLRFAVFDAVPLSDWNNRSSSLVYSDRLTLLRTTVNRISDYPKIIDTPTDTVNNSAELVSIYKNHLTKGLEGSMIKTIDGLYKWGRCGVKGQVLKLKPFKSEDLVVTGLFDGKGKLEGTIGGLLCKYKGQDDFVRVGTGFTMADRQEVSANPENYIGKVAEIKYMEHTKDGNLRHPVFARWRPDKDVKKKI